MRNESDWAYLPQSEERVVAQQIKQHSRQDAAYLAKTGENSLLESAGGFGVSEAVLCTYIDLDRQIEACEMSVEQREMLALLMKGYTLNDIAELRQQDWKRVERNFRNAVSSIVRENNRCWEKSYANASRKPRRARMYHMGEEGFSRKRLLLWIRREKVLLAECNIRGKRHGVEIWHHIAQRREVYAAIQSRTKQGKVD